ncbi:MULTISPECIES: archaeal heat shock protein Hsp20 [Acidiplasma]|jgi:HSP20 family protein|uniref:Molecular chaperone n=2 Tax=Acidiplasma TaxID=507753 RepID=A0A0Q0RGN7_9ARCH|nr:MULTISPECIES: archaeal heat shock protein Hsp20 [Acidiplasma]KJE48814.1 molecular chaperone [Acidiplasma sp. MBA-1]KPV47310.1 molecular chaperone [Acidiplasma aeolicum]KQB34304.1 molecular chaperone [Acidiplasma cupricumulans]KQB36136.1 molecular chaperone [Acidiplasma aeolicum]WMT54204.1 MAG: archaeal heat shock protein Hsp20 [Acidiplasma sp.]
MVDKKYDDWDDIFDELYDEFGFDMRRINNEIAKFWESVMKGNSNAKVMGPYVYGFTYKIGPDGKPTFQEFGNVPRRLGFNENIKEGFREPLTDINEDNKNIYITYELPGVDKSDIKLTVNEYNVELTVDTDKRKYYKNIEFNTPVDVNSVSAKFTNGVLDVTISKTGGRNSGKTVKID